MGFQENLKEQLSYSGMYVKELAALSGVKKKTIDSYLKSDNSSVPSAEAAVAIARALGVTVEFLVMDRELAQNREGVFDPPYTESHLIANIASQLNKTNRKTILALAKILKKQEDEVKMS